MKIYAIIVTYCAENFIEKTIKSILSSTVDLELIIIDNNSCDKTPEILHKFSNIRLIQNPKNIGFGRACNQGMKIALKENADYVVLINQDVEVYPDTIEKLIQIHKKNPQLGIISPLQLNNENKPADLVYYWFVKSNRSFFDDLFNNKLQELYEIDFVSASFWLIPKEILSVVGGFNPLFFMYGEDTEYCNRVRFHGYKIAIVPHAFYKHYKINFYKKTAKRQILEIRNFVFIEQLSDFNYTLWQNLKAAFRKAYSEIIKSIFMLHLKNFTIYFLGTISFLLISPKAIKYHHKEKEKHSIFL